jgi:hypothetical protein
LAFASVFSGLRPLARTEQVNRSFRELLDILDQLAANCASQHLKSRQRKASMGRNYKTAKGSGSAGPANVLSPGLNIDLPAVHKPRIFGIASLAGGSVPSASLVALAHEYALVRLEEE